MIPVQTPLPKIPLGTAVEVLIEWIQVHLHGFLTAISRAGTLVNDNLVDLLLAVPPLLMVVVFVLVAWMAKSWRLAGGTAGTFLIDGVRQLELLPHHHGVGSRGFECHSVCFQACPC